MFLIDLFFPKFCINCGYVGAYVCPSCSKKLETVNHDICFYCKKPSLFGLTHINCVNKLNIDGLISIYLYNPILKKIIKNIKYRLAVQVWEDFYKTITPNIIDKLGFYNNLSCDFAIQPIPLSKTKYNDRGFNQAKIIAIFFNKFLNFPIMDLLIRIDDRSSQAKTKDKKNRFKNIKGIFKINLKNQNNKSYIPENIILIDDVITSGATVEEAAKILKQNGVKKIYVLTLAKG